MKGTGVHHNILIVRTDRIGDVILTIPMASAMKHSFPGARITMLVREYTAPLVERHPDIDEVVTIAEEHDISAILPKLKLMHFTRVYCPSPSFATARAVKRAGIPVRIGTAYRWYSSLFFNVKIRDHRKNARFHEAEANIRMVNNALPCGPETFPVRFSAQESAREHVAQLLAGFGITRGAPYIIIHPASGGSARDLPIERFAHLAMRIREELRCPVIFTGTFVEFPVVRSLQALTGIQSIAVGLPLADIIALVEQAAVVVTNSTGVLHIAAATGTFPVGFYPPILACSPKRWGPWTNRAKVFVPSVDFNCNRCTDYACTNFYCMRQISIDDVIHTIRAQLHPPMGNAR